MRILLIESDRPTTQSIELMLQSEEFNVFTTAHGEEGADRARRHDYDVILLDPDLPDMSGREVLRKLRENAVRAPILILSDRAGVANLSRGFGFGADGYMTKPVQQDELLAGIDAVVHDFQDHASTVIKTGDLEVDLITKTATIGGERVHLDGKAYQMLELLARGKGFVVTKEDFLEHLYGGMDEPEIKIIDVFVCVLRKRLQTASRGRNYIQTIWGKGYLLRDQHSGNPCSG